MSGSAGAEPAEPSKPSEPSEPTRPTESAAARRGRGRPRSEPARRAILDAAGDLTIEGGVAAATMEAIASRAGVSKATIYKWWPSRGAVVLEALLDRMGPPVQPADDAPAVPALQLQLTALIRQFRDSTAGPLLQALTAESESDPALASELRARWLLPRRAASVAVVQRGIHRGELRDDLDPEVVVDLLFAPVLTRLVYGHAPLPDRLAGALLRHLQRGLEGPDGSASPGSSSPGSSSTGSDPAADRTGSRTAR